MQYFTELAQSFDLYFKKLSFPETPENLYGAADYMLQMGGKRIRPTLVLMGNELFGNIHSDAFKAASAIELFHNFSLIHDDIMDQAPLRRGQTTVHYKFGESTAILSGDVLLVYAYKLLGEMQGDYLKDIICLFSKTAVEVCEGQQLDMDFEKSETVSLDDYVHMIGLKTSVLLAAALEMGAIIGGAGLGNRENLYAFGKNLGIAFQIQDDYLDVFGDPEKVGKQPGGDILSNKKTFLQIYAMEQASPEDKKSLRQWMADNNADPALKVKSVTEIFKRCGADVWAGALKESYFQRASEHLESVAVVSSNKSALKQLAAYLLQREH